MNFFSFVLGEHESVCVCVCVLNNNAPRYASASSWNFPILCEQWISTFDVRPWYRCAHGHRPLIRENTHFFYLFPNTTDVSTFFDKTNSRNTNSGKMCCVHGFPKQRRAWRLWYTHYTVLRYFFSYFGVVCGFCI